MRRRVLAVLSIAAISALFSPPVAFADRPGLSFLEPGPMKVSSADLSHGRSVKVCNTTGAPVFLRPVLTGEELSVDTKKVSLNKSVTALVAKARVRAGRCRSIELRFRDGKEHKIDAGTSATATLTVLAPAAGSARISLAISGADAPKLQGAFHDLAVRATRTWHFQKRRPWDWTLDAWTGDAVLEENGLALSYSMTPPKKPSSGSWPVADGSRVGRLVVDGTPQAMDQALVVPFKLTDVHNPGTYHGTLDFGGGEKNRLPIVVTAADPVGVLIFCVLLGVLIALMVRLASGRFRYTFRLRAERRKVQDRYVDAAETVVEPWATRFPRPTDAAIETWQADNKAALKAYRRTVVTVDVTDEAFVSVRKNVAAALDDADCYGKSLPAKLAALQVSLDSVVKMLDTLFPGLPDPDVVTLARRITRQHVAATPTLGIGEATKIRDKADQCVKLLDAWSETAATLVRYGRWVRKIWVVADEVDRVQLAFAGGTLSIAVYELFDADAADEVQGVLTGSNLRTVYAVLASLGAQYGVWVGDEPLATAETSSSTDSLLQHQVFVGIQSQPLTRAVRWANEALAPFEFQVVHKYAAAVAGLFAAMVVVSLGALVASFTAVYAAYQLLYEGKPFGPWVGYFGAVVAGIGAAAVVDAVVNGANWARGGLSAVTKA